MLTNVRIEEVRATLAPLRRAGKRIGLVPTMGYLHDGHMALMRRARQENDYVVASIFVNPIQFGANEDLSKYPRDLERDSGMLAAVGVDLLFAPTVDVMYPKPTQTFVDVPGLGGLLEGGVRPGHFRGVATVVTKLFNIVQPDNAYFGEKDYQQVLIIEQMVADLSFATKITCVPTVREPDGLAMSSRNVYLTPEQRRAAVRLNQSLKFAEERVMAGERDPAALEKAVRAYIAEEPLAEPDVVAVRDARTLRELTGPISSPIAVVLLVRFGAARLLDERVIALP
ncbi:MAG TPA: pantoate--beta-alanine ligase [Burkholderiaceae bacterium]|nr:pantoate--beta-alanine ligase [Burkholderiaceae bacterium]